MKKINFRMSLCMSFAVMLFGTISALNISAMAEETSIPQETVVTVEKGEPFSEDTDILTRDLLYDKSTNKQFITVEDRDGNIFYLVIDYDAPVNEKEEQYKTYFLNPVDTDDLKALAKEDDEEPPSCICADKCVPGRVNMNCPVCSANMSECMGREIPPQEEPKETEPPVQEPEKKTGINPMIVLVLLIGLGVAGAFVYIKFFKKPKSDDINMDDYDYDDEEETEREVEDEETDSRE